MRLADYLAEAFNEAVEWTTDGGAQDNLVAKKAVSRARDDDDEGIREGQGNTIVNGVAVSNKGNVTWICFFASFLMQRVML
ncbi:hypothetical protein Dimus_000838 [Dionaea muscipula]